LAAVDERETLRSAMEDLAPRERVILYERFFKEASQSEVASRLGLSQMHVSRLEPRTLRRLREVLR
jgi:RNA polymerase sigma-B factor